MMDTTSSIKKDRIKKENKLQITKITPKKKECNLKRFKR